MLAWILDRLHHYAIYIGLISYALSAPFIIYAIHKYVWPPRNRLNNVLRLVLIVLVVSACVGLGNTAVSMFGAAIEYKDRLLLDIERAPFTMLELFLFYACTIGIPISLTLTAVAMGRAVGWHYVVMVYLSALFAADGVYFLVLSAEWRKQPLRSGKVNCGMPS